MVCKSSQILFPMSSPRSPSISGGHGASLSGRSHGAFGLRRCGASVGLDEAGDVMIFCLGPTDYL